MADPIIRPIRPEDHQDLWEARTQPVACWGTLQLPTLPRSLLKAQSAFQPNVYCFVAEVDGKAVGMCGIHMGAGLRSRHAAGFGISIHDVYQDRGLGTRLTAAALDLADNYLGLERVELDVFTDNARAIHLYERFGFEPEGILRGMAFRDGAYVDALQMSRLRGRAAAAPRTVEPAPARSARGLPPADLTIRAVHPDDVPALHRLYLQPGVLAHLERTSALHIDVVKQEVSNLTGEQHYVVAETGGQVVGAAYLSQNRPGRRSHVGLIEWIAVDETWQGQGIGTALLAYLVNLADRWLALRRLELKIPADAGPALTVARKLGFETEAVLRAAFFRGGSFVDVYALGRMGQR